MAMMGLLFAAKKAAAVYQLSGDFILNATRTHKIKKLALV